LGYTEFIDKTCLTFHVSTLVGRSGARSPAESGSLKCYNRQAH